MPSNSKDILQRALVSVYREEKKKKKEKEEKVLGVGFFQLVTISFKNICNLKYIFDFQLCNSANCGYNCGCT